ncbi:linoleate 13S-lipoxygenase 2-1, chloroplastic-like [Chenopodium quinoa]|uniref:linoleate 13S-lipoxygenase 2-1, chloroplastic-like n=1 Tax=Chenopodium quinoa TaxID=63459 RepID=UPI000B7906F5|nr:linoleate 13S-lipoxygenase 2-1, chloroplastic-like [Chenopodium quinoa]
MAKKISVRAIVTVQLTATGFLKNIGLGQGIDGISDLLLGNALHLELVSSADPKLGANLEKEAIRAPAKLNIFLRPEENETKYESKLQVHENFGELGAILVTNEHRREMFAKDIVLEGLPQGVVKVDCESWVHSKYDNPEKRIFFANKAYLPSQTPAGLKSLREKDLESLRGNGQGERRSYDRIYDYDTYNDIGDPDSNSELLRPVLGTKKHPYPRRCRTGRPPAKKDPSSEERAGSFYVPRDENFSDLKSITFGINVLDNVLHALLPSLEATIVDTNLGFESFKEILVLFNKGIELSDMKNRSNMKDQLPNLFDSKDVISFPTTELMDRDEFAWFRDDEFARETLAGLNPYAIKLVTEWPLKSNLDPEVYGPPESAITSKLVEEEIMGIMSVKEALEKKKLFMLDYHDLLLPFVNKVRQIKDTTLYGSRTLFFLTPEGTLRPIAIELTRPPTDDGKPQWKQVFSPSCGDATEGWLWRLAKAHVLAHDSGHHQLISHWLRTHCCVEPYIIAAHRQLSAMHPIFRLMNPYFRFTMMINALARQALINAGGIIETSFSTEKYSMEFSSYVYDKEWRFDQQGLPADLIARGLAIEDPSAPHGLQLTIEDYPFANDGLILWDAIKQWVTDYVNHYYATEHLVKDDNELQAWWEEIRTKGHQDKKDETWWPVLDTPSSLIEVLTSMIWVTSGHHAAVNFGQYAYAGYFPNRPTIARINMPSEDPTKETKTNFAKDPVGFLLQTFPSKLQATKVMAVLSVLSNHSPDEEYIGDQTEPSWAEDPTIKSAFERFNASLKNLENVVDSRNADNKWKNRNGAGTLPYQLLKPFSKSGVTGMGVPNSISI